MRELFTLGPRLQKCADFVREGTRVADIGTDHGYLGIWLLKTGRAGAALGADVNPGPLQAAAENAVKYGVPLETRLSDGFAECVPQEVEDAVIAGMGGELIARIIGAAPWLKTPEKHLVLQPMTGADKLRRFLFDTGFSILREEAVAENGKLYTVLLAAYGPGAPKSVHMGGIVPGSPHSAEYARFVVHGLENRAKGLTGRNLAACQKEIEQIKRTYL